MGGTVVEGILVRAFLLVCLGEPAAILCGHIAVRVSHLLQAVIFESMFVIAVSLFQRFEIAVSM